MLHRKLLWFGLGFLIFSGITAALVFTVTYKPYGVPDERRDEWETLVAKAKMRNAIAHNTEEGQFPKARFKKTSHDFGLLDPHTTASYHFAVINDGNAALRLSIESTSCKCTVGKLAGDLLLPGESTDITLTWNTGMQSAVYEQTAIVKTNEPVDNTHTLTVSGEVKAELIAPGKVSLSKENLGGVASGTFPLYSQLWDDFEVSEIQFETEEDYESEIEWTAEPADLTEARFSDVSPKSAVDVKLSRTVLLRKPFVGKMTVTIVPGNGDEAVTREIELVGQVKPPITFLSPEIDRRAGLELGTLTSGKEHKFYLTVRANGAPDREIKVLDLRPNELEASIKPARKEGHHRLEIVVPADCPMVVFNRDDQHGYVQVGDPNDENFSGWFPLVGAVVKLD